MRSVVVGTAGHIDHGKSALVRALTGTDPDRLKEEKARGITIDLGFAHLETGGVTLSFVDVPGHERFVKNMLAGAGGIDLVLLVVAADESVMPQTREHFQICRLLQVPAGVIALTKSDAADPELVELARLEVRELVAGSFLAGAPIVVVSAKTGAGLDELMRALAGAALQLPARRRDGPVRLPIDRVFSVKGFGTVATGTLVSGEIRGEQELEVLPRGAAAKVRGLQVHGRPEVSAGAGRRLAVNLGGVATEELARGDSLCTPAAFEPTRRIDTSIDLLPDARPLRHGARVRFHQGTTEILGRISLASVDARPPGQATGTGNGDRQRGQASGTGSRSEVPPGRSAFVRIRLERPAVLTRGDRFILRAYSPPVTVGGGVVLDPQPPRSAVRTQLSRQRFERLFPADGSRAALDAAVAVFLGERGAAGLSTGEIVRRAGVSHADAGEGRDRAMAAGAATLVEDLIVDPDALALLGARLVAALGAHHAAEPLSEGLPREEARERLFGRAAPVVFEHVLATLAGAGTIVARDRLALARHRVALSPEESRACDALAAAYREAGLAPPDLSSAATAAGIPAPLADRMAKHLVRQKALVKVDVLLFDPAALNRLKTEVRALKAAGPARVDVASFKERYGITRKYAIPLLEYLDRERVTRRMGDSRVVL